MTVIDETGAGAPSGLLRRGARLLVDSVRAHPRPFVVSVLGSALYGTMAVAGAAAVGVVTDRVIVPGFAGEGPVHEAPLAAAALVGIAVLRSTGVVLRRYFGNMTTRRMQRTWLGRVVDTYLRVPLDYFGRQPTGRLLAHADADVERAVGVIQPLPFSIGVAVLMAVALVALALVDPVLMLVAIVVFPALGLLNRAYTHRVEEPAALAQARTGEVSSLAHESFDGALVVKTLGLEDVQVRRLAGAADGLRSARLRVGRLRAAFEPALDTLTSLGTIALLAVGSWRMSEGAVTAGQLVQAMTLFGILALPVRVVGFLLEEIPRAVAAADRLATVLAEPSSTPAPPTATVTATAAAPAVALPAGPLDVRVEGLAFAHGDGGVPVLDGLGLELAAGEVVALVGPTASGKTTLCHLLARLHEPTAGTIRLGGVDARLADPASVRRSVALAFQEPFLFGTTVRDNVTLGEPATDDEVTAALVLACADGFVGRLPGGLDEPVGERGVTLSGGERQRLALARALLRRPGLLLLDDATSAVDPTVELQVLDNLRGERGATTLLVAHRLSTIALADRVAFLDGGRIAATGAHDDLVATVPAYAALALAYQRHAR